MSKLIALVATAVYVDGVRTVIQPGEALPGISKHDERELLQSGAAENPADTAAQAKADARAKAAADAEFQATRQQVQQAQASTAEDGKQADPAAPAKAASKTPARK